MVDSKFAKIVQEGDCKAIRNALIGILVAHPDMQDGTFKEALDYAYGQIGENLYVPKSNAISMQSDQHAWTPDYMAELTLALRRAFTQEVIQHIQKVGPVAYKEQYEKKQVKIQGQSVSPSIEPQPINKRYTLWVILIIVLLGVAGWMVVNVSPKSEINSQTTNNTILKAGSG